MYTGKFTIFFVHFFHFQHYGIFEGLNSYKYSNKILFISFDTDTIAIMCANNNAREKLVSYFQKHGLGAESISKECR